MAKTNKKKVVVNVKSDSEKLKPTASRSGQKKLTTEDSLLFGKENFKWILIGLGLITIGFVLMGGGAMPDPNTWDETLIYSHRRITIAPILILSGLAVEIYAIFK